VQENITLMANILEQAHSAAKQKNWSLLNQCLQQLPLGKKVGDSDVDSQPLEDADLEQVLNLALNVLDAGDFQERWDVAKVFPKLGARAIAPLIEILEDEEADLELRWFAARILGEFNDPVVVTSLVELLGTSEDEELIEMAAAALTNLGASAIDALSKLLAQSESRLLAVRSLSQIRRSEIITPLLSVVHDQQVPVRSAAIEALSSFHDSRIDPVLLDALNDLAAPVRKEAAIALGLRSDLQEKVDLVNSLKPLLFDLNLEVCSCAAISLGRVGTNDAALTLFEVLKSPATPLPLQLIVVRALGWVATSGALEYLRQALSWAPVEVCQEIVTLLGRLEEPNLKPQAAEILIEFLNSGDAAQEASLKQSLALALGQLGEIAALDQLIQLLADSDASVRLHAIAALKNLAPEEAHRKLQQLAANEQLAPALKQGIAIALQEWQLNECNS
jgi:HEAT repeat protein